MMLVLPSVVNVIEFFLVIMSSLSCSYTESEEVLTAIMTTNDD